MPMSIDVHLLSGKMVSLEVEADESADSLSQRAQCALAVGKGRLLTSSGDVLDRETTIKRARLQSGDALTLHVKQVQVVASKPANSRSCCGAAFAAILGDGSVRTWGLADYGGDSSAVQCQLKDVKQIQATERAFAAILGTGSVVTWGDSRFGGDSKAVQDQLKGVKQIQASHSAFAAILGNGSVVTWGRACSGGDSTAVQDQLKDVQQIQACHSGFAAILGNRTVVTWAGGECAPALMALQGQLDDVQHLQASEYAFSAIQGDGSVVTWGDAGFGGDSKTVQDQLRDVRQIQVSFAAFAAILADGSVVTWGDMVFGGDSSTVQAQLLGLSVVPLYASWTLGVCRSTRKNKPKNRGLNNYQDYIIIVRYTPKPNSIIMKAPLLLGTEARRCPATPVFLWSFCRDPRQWCCGDLGQCSIRWRQPLCSRSAEGGEASASF